MLEPIIFEAAALLENMPALKEMLGAGIPLYRTVKGNIEDPTALLGQMPLGRVGGYPIVSRGHTSK